MELQKKIDEYLNSTFIFTEEYSGIPAGEHLITKCDEHVVFVETKEDGVLILDQDALTSALLCGIIRPKIEKNMAVIT